MVGWSDPFDLRRSHGTGRLALMALMVVGSVGAIIAGAILLGRAHDTPGWQFRQKTKHFTSSGERAVLEKANFIVKSPWSSSHYHWVYDQSINEFGSQQTSNPRLMPSVDLRSMPTSLPLPTCLTVYGDSQALLNLPECPDGSGHGIAAFSWRESVTLELPDGKQCDAQCCTDNGGRWGSDGCHFYEIPERVCVKALKTIAGWVYMGSCQDDGSHTTWTPATYGLAYRVMPALEIRSPSDPVLAYAPYANSASYMPKVAKSWAGQAPQWWLGLALLLAGCLLLLSAVVATTMRVRQWRREEKLLHESQIRSDAGVRPSQVIA